MYKRDGCGSGDALGCEEATMRDGISQSIRLPSFAFARDSNGCLGVCSSRQG